MMSRITQHVLAFTCLSENRNNANLKILVGAEATTIPQQPTIYELRCLGPSFLATNLLFPSLYHHTFR